MVKNVPGLSCKSLKLERDQAGLKGPKAFAVSSSCLHPHFQKMSKLGVKREHGERKMLKLGKHTLKIVEKLSRMR